jgi:hypothetical protein
MFRVRNNSRSSDLLLSIFLLSGFVNCFMPYRYSSPLSLLLAVDGFPVVSSRPEADEEKVPINSSEQKIKQTAE